MLEISYYLGGFSLQIGRREQINHVNKPRNFFTL